eukprot:maker-scaffold_12-snap-gene-5.28-mRNA-1 protein AED:0.00 eAED:0.00 QI:0/1/0.5/1/1/1/2/27/324
MKTEGNAAYGTFIEHERLLDRNSPFHQSSGYWNIRKKNKPNILYFKDLFHSLTNISTHKLILIFFFTYINTILIFAFLYDLSSRMCFDEKHQTLYQDFYLSLQVFTTIGFGLPKPSDDDSLNNGSFFEHCTAGLFVLTLESISSVLFDCIFIGLVYQRISRAQPRSNSIIFSNKAVINEGKLSFRIVELRKHQIIESHCQVYLYYNSITGAKTVELKQDSSDRPSGFLLLAFPQTIYLDLLETNPVFLEHSFLDLTSQTASNEFEIIITVEGIDALTSDTVQARHSYRGKDIVFGKKHSKCMFQEPNRSYYIDFGLFHQVEAVQ